MPYSFGETRCLRLQGRTLRPWKPKQQIITKHGYSKTNLYGATFYNDVISKTDYVDARRLPINVTSERNVTANSKQQVAPCTGLWKQILQDLCVPIFDAHLSPHKLLLLFQCSHAVRRRNFMLLILMFWMIFRDDLLRLGVVGSSRCRRVGRGLYYYAMTHKRLTYFQVADGLFHN
jgi:hypothetical protein